MKKLFSIKYSASSFDFALLLLRVVAGSAMMMHGYGKLVNFKTMLAKGFADPFGLGQTVSLSLTVFAEFFCAIFVILGIFTRLASIPVIICMSVAFFSAHNAHLFSDGELAGIYLTIFTVILFVGPGRVSVDRLIGK
jgi:putative oxidoreductase